MNSSLDQPTPVRALSNDEVDTVSGGLSLIGPLIIILGLVAKVVNNPGKPITTK